MLLSIHCSGQGTKPIDSLELYCQPKWIVWRISRDLATLDRQSILLDSAHQVIKLKNVALKDAELTQAAQDSAYLAKDNEAKECRSMVAAKDQLHKSELKSERKKGRTEGAIGAGGIWLILLVLALL